MASRNASARASAWFSGRPGSFKRPTNLWVSKVTALINDSECNTVGTRNIAPAFANSESAARGFMTVRPPRLCGLAYALVLVHRSLRRMRRKFDVDYRFRVRLRFDVGSAPLRRA